MTKLRLLHVTDCHLAEALSVDSMDIKLAAPGISKPLRQEVLRDTLSSLRDCLLGRGEKLDAVIFSGDGTFKGHNSGQLALRHLLLDVLGPVGLTAANLVATPGNHDVVAGTLPGRAERYRLFKEAWIGEAPVIVPFLDGIHDRTRVDPRSHVLRHPEGQWAIFPINSSNWSQLRLDQEGNREAALIREHLKTIGNTDLEKAFESLCSYDVARISEDQSRVLRELVGMVGEVKIRIAVLHHHLLPVDSREEFKPFCDITNLGHLRQLLKELDFHIVLHGHKHSAAAYYDYVSPEGGAGAQPHRMLTISGGTFGAQGQGTENAAQVITLEELLYAPTCTVQPIGMTRAGRSLPTLEPRTYRLWESDSDSLGPAFVAGTSIDEVYCRVLQTVKDSPGRPLVCTLELDQNTLNPFPTSYPYGKNEDEKREWFKETVAWWQQPASRIEVRIPYIHGSRLKRYGGGFDQIERIVTLLKEGVATSKAIAIVVDPARDFGGGTAFASFCLVQFCLRSERTLDCVGYYRTQEFNYWWPVNIAELRHLQAGIAARLNLKCGKITTITPYPRLSENVRSPTKVAVPLIDQWVDNHPGRIAQIALSLSGSRDEASSDGVIYWRRCLDDLEQGAESYHSDGTPVAIEGLALLKEWLIVTDAPEQVISLVEQLHDANDAHRNIDSTDAFNRWQRQVRPKLAELRRLSL